MTQDVIPKGHYCYTPIEIGDDGKMKINTCTYWSNHPEHGYQESGHCSFLNVSDWQNKNQTTFLWDKVKECGINMEESL